MRISIAGNGGIEASIDIEIGENSCSVMVGWDGIYKGVQVKNLREAGNSFIRAGKILLLFDEFERLNKIVELGEINPRPFRVIMNILDDLKALGWEPVNEKK
jgi:hypothetical protein